MRFICSQIAIMKLFQQTITSLAVALALSACGGSSPDKKTASEETNAASAPAERTVWTKQAANAWYAQQGWLVGANFLPSTAINQLEMWQAESFDTATIDRELGWAQALGMNTMRVFLHDLLHQQDSTGLYQRMEVFLQIASKHKIRPLFVFFDSCWDPFPKLGKQRDPQPFTHNSGWVQSPGQAALKDTSSYARLELYIKGVVHRFALDNRVLGWDIWNEPDNLTGASYERFEPKNKADLVLPLLKKSFDWARSQQPSQPLTSGLWTGRWEQHDSMTVLQQVQVDQSDLISFHSYDSLPFFEKRVASLAQYGKPLFCTEYMARPNGSSFAAILPAGKQHNIAMYNWGFVDGKSQTIYPWDSWTKKYTGEPPVWFHDIFRRNGKPYRPAETDLIKQLTGVTP